MRPHWWHLLARAVGDRLLPPGSPGYDDTCSLFNAAIARRPAAVIRAASVADVQAAVALAADEGLPVAARAGGHGVSGHALCDGGLVIDVRSLREIVLDASRAAVTIGAGCTWGDVLEALEPHGVATPGGFDVRVGVAGSTLGGGYGALSRLHGLAADNLLAAWLVDAAGNRTMATDTTTPELMWALRGAGSSFGVVTSMTLRVHPLPPLVAGALATPLAHAADLMRAWRDVAATLPDEQTAYFGIDTAPDGSGYAMVAWFSFGGPPDGLAALRRAAPLVHDDVAPAGYRAMHVANETTFPPGHHHDWRARFLPALDDASFDAIVAHATRARGMWLVIEHMGGAMARVAPDATAFPHRDARFGVVSAVRWLPGARPDDNLAIARELHAALAPAGAGSYVQYLMEDDAEAAYRGNLPRLRALKRRLDPAGRFRGVIDLSDGGT